MNTEPYTRAYAAIDLDAAAFNASSIRDSLAPGVSLNAVVKADGYGHGAVPVARAVEPFVEAYSVATLDEGLNLRENGIVKPIYVLGVVHPLSYRQMAEQGLRPPIFTLEQALPLSETALSIGRTIPIHLAVDTGMSRIGLTPDDAGADLAKEIASLPGIEIEGVFTHFARANEEDKTPTLAQLKKYDHFIGLLEERGVNVKIRDTSNSAAIMSFPEAHFDMVRAGILLYGLYPSDTGDKNRVPVKPVMGLKSFVVFVKTVPEGTAIGYGGTYVTEKESRIATVSIGYADGYPRALSNRADVLIAGKRAPLRGSVCMDQIMVDVTDIPEACVGMEVTLMGRDGDECITAEEIAEKAGSIHYEIVCDIGKRIPRVYYRGGDIVGTKDYFHDRYDDIKW